MIQHPEENIVLCFSLDTAPLSPWHIYCCAGDCMHMLACVEQDSLRSLEPVFVLISEGTSVKTPELPYNSRAYAVVGREGVHSLLQVALWMAV